MIVNLHGTHSNWESDGYPETWYLPKATDIPDGYATGGTFYEGQEEHTGCITNTYNNDQPTTALWYHDHSLGITRLNVYAGGAGYYFICDENDKETGLIDGKLPSPPPKFGQDPNDPEHQKKIREIPLVIQDKSFYKDGSQFFPDNREFWEGHGDGTRRRKNDVTGEFLKFTPNDNAKISPIWVPDAFFDTIVINGNTWPYLKVAQERYRFHLLSACDTRILNISLKRNSCDDIDEIPFHVFGSDQSLAPHIATIKTGAHKSNHIVYSVQEEQALLLAPAERYDVIVDFSDIPDGTVIMMCNTGPDDFFLGFPLGDTVADPKTTDQIIKPLFMKQITRKMAT